MILVDTSVVIDYARGKDAKLVAHLPTRSVAVCGIVRAELLCGARDAKHRADLVIVLRTFNQLAISESMWDTVGDNLASLRSKGVTVPLPDVVIATLGIESNMEVWSRDAHFPAMQKILPALQLYQEPP
jgi:predicted nucleic acid-binding protein